MDQAVKTFNYPEDVPPGTDPNPSGGLLLESGIQLSRFHLAYTTYGTMNAGGNNVIWIFHALTANSQPQQWWDGLVGPAKLLDTDRFYIVCANVPGSCYGSIGPLDEQPGKGKKYYYDFPLFTTRDIVNAFKQLRHHLGIREIFLGIGGSLGGQQLLEWAIEEPALFKKIVPIATNAIHSPWGIAFNATQRMAIEADGTWGNLHPDAGLKGMKAARALALLSYRSYDGYRKTQAHNESQLVIKPEGESVGGAASYQRYQGQKLANRFNAFSYYQLSKTMDSHNVGRGRGDIATALKRITAQTLVLGIDSDVLFPLAEQEYLAANIPGAALGVIHSLFGHDGFLLEYPQLAHFLIPFLNE